MIPTKTYSAMLYALADDLVAAGLIDNSAEVEQAAERLDLLTVTIRGLEIQRDELLAVFSLVIDEIDKRNRTSEDAPGHCHDIPGVWDSDNGALAGKPCAWCAIWNKAKALCSTTASAA